MRFVRDSIIQLTSIAFLGALVAYAAKALGVEKSVILVGLVGVGVGWGACWLHNAWFGQPKSMGKLDDQRRPSKAPLHEESDKIFHVDATASQKASQRTRFEP